ncbi:MAG: corrinoid protein [Bacillota bacterium]
MDLAEQLKAAIMEGAAERARELTKRALEAGVRCEILNGWMMRAMDEVGRRFERGEAFIPELLVAARALRCSLELLASDKGGSAIDTAGRVVIGTVKGDLHDIGKNFVAMMLQGAGFSVTDLGVDVPPERFVQSVREHKPDLLGLSALLTTTMLNMRATIRGLEEAGLRGSVKVMIGGAPVTEKFAREIGADGYAENAFAAVGLAKRLLGRG